MEDFAIVLSTSEQYLAQALAMYEQLRACGFEKYAWVVPLEPLSPENLESLRARFGSHVTETLQLPKNIKRSGNKIFLPTMIPAVKKYILIDTDILIAKCQFIDILLDAPSDRIVLVQDSFNWQDWLALSSLAERAQFTPQVRHLLNKPYIQTGNIGISNPIHKKIFDSFVLELTDDSHVYRGDLPIWNDWVYRFPHLFHLVPPHVCLILRPDASGPSSTLHLPNLNYQEDIWHYQNSPILSLHFTCSQGMVRSWQDYEQLKRFKKS
ncbi:MAG: hypothetical protein AAGA60_17915 [Cyanobacteria bacterium P01_E01_bin.42]